MLVIRVRNNGVVHILDNATGKPLVDLQIVHIGMDTVKVGFTDPPSGREVAILRDGVKYDGRDDRSA